MIIIDRALAAREEQGQPLRVGLIGAGFMGQGLANQIMHSVPGMRVSAVYSRDVPRAIRLFNYAGTTAVAEATTQRQVDDAVRAGRPVVTQDASLLARAAEIDVLVDVTGSVEFGARVVL